MQLRPYKKIRELESELEELRNELEDKNNRIEELEEEKYIEETSENSRITFFVDNDLNVSTKTFINRAIENTLLNNDFLTESQIGDDMANHLALILIANEVTTQYITNFERNKKKES